MICFSLGILIIFLGASRLTGRSFAINLPRLSKYFFAATIILIFIFLFFQSYQQYQLWLKNDISKHLLPPYQDINYFIFYSLTRFFGPYLISLATGILFLFSAKILNKKYQKRFFYPEEPYFGALAVFLAGWPGLLFYIIFLTLIYLFIHLYSLFIIHNSQRISLYYLWLPVAIFVILIQKWLELLPLWKLLKF